MSAFLVLVFIFVSLEYCFHFVGEDPHITIGTVSHSTFSILPAVYTLKKIRYANVFYFIETITRSLIVKNRKQFLYNHYT